MITSIVAACRRWVAAQDERNRLINLGSQIVGENRSPATYDERRAVAAYDEWVDAQW